MRKLIIAGAAFIVALGAALLIPIQREAGPSASSEREPRKPAPTGAPAPARAVSLLFIHHSVGSQLLAEPGEGPGKDWRGGGFRKLLDGAGYRVHSATYGSPLGEDTDLFDFKEKFTKNMAHVLTTADGTRPLPDGKKHDVVLFKACYPNNAFDERGTPPGKVDGPELTIENAKAALASWLPEFQKHPDTLFVYLTAPPLAPRSWPEPAWKWLVKSVIGRTATERMAAQAVLAREFNDWVAAPDGWLSGYPLKNVAVIHYYDILTGYGASDLLLYPTGDRADSHPSSEGQKLAAPVILDQLNAAVLRAGIGTLAANTAAPADGSTPAAATREASLLH